MNEPISLRSEARRLTFEHHYLLLISWKPDELLAVVAGKMFYLGSVGLCLLDEEAISRAEMSPQKDDLDSKWMDGMARGVEFTIIP